MSALDDAARDVETARETVHEWLYPLTATRTAQARAAVAAFEQAVRRHDAEIARAEQLEDMDGFVIRPDFRAAWEEGRNLAGDAISEYVPPEETSEVEVRFASGPTVRIGRYTVTTEAAVGVVAVEGFLASWAGIPRSGDAVRITHLGIPGRGALADITASVAVYSRLDVLHIRIRTTIQGEETP